METRGAERLLRSLIREIALHLNEAGEDWRTPKRPYANLPPEARLKMAQGEFTRALRDHGIAKSKLSALIADRDAAVSQRNRLKLQTLEPQVEAATSAEALAYRRLRDAAAALSAEGGQGVLPGRGG